MFDLLIHSPARFQLSPA